MNHTTIVIALVFCAVAFAAPDVATAQFQGRNCPIVEDQLVVIDRNQPTAFSLRVADLGDGDVSIFQFPLGGILEQSGATPLDFVFVPDINFNGTTSFTYRLTPPRNCPRGVQLGRVTLAGGTASGTAGGLSVDPSPGSSPLLCGVGLFGPLTIGIGLIGLSHRRRRGR
ncbi:MAG: hypothetical protein MI923_05150 [Phycisphaerales bacterium]|nr:hypothetical protein [Phycisphaerales bacterium]